MTSAVEEQFAIYQLIARYTHTIDSRDYDEWLECFTPDGVLHTALGVSSGRDELQAFVKDYEARRARLPNVRHLITNIAVYVEGEQATARSYVIMTTSDPSGVKIIISGQYDDKLVKINGAWKFKLRLSVPDTSVADSAAYREQQTLAKAK